MWDVEIKPSCVQILILRSWDHFVWPGDGLSCDLCRHISECSYCRTYTCVCSSHRCVALGTCGVCGLTWDNRSLYLRCVYTAISLGSWAALSFCGCLLSGMEWSTASVAAALSFHLVIAHQAGRGLVWKEVGQWTIGRSLGVAGSLFRRTVSTGRNWYSVRSRSIIWCCLSYSFGFQLTIDFFRSVLRATISYNVAVLSWWHDMRVIQKQFV